MWLLVMAVWIHGQFADVVPQTFDSGRECAAAARKLGLVKQPNGVWIRRGDGFEIHGECVSRKALTG